MNGYSAQGSIITSDGVKKTKRSGFGNDGCCSLQNAKRKVMIGLSNKLRSHQEGVEGWVWWPNLSLHERNHWLDRVAETLQWDELSSGKAASLRTISSDDFSKALRGALA